MAFIERAKKRVAAESAKILEAEKMRRIYQDELEKELQEVREEAERQKVGVVEVNPVAEFEAELSRVRAQLVQLQGSRQTHSMWTQCETPMFVGTRASADSANAHFGSCRVECVAIQISTTHSSTETPVVSWSSSQCCQTGPNVWWK